MRSAAEEVVVDDDAGEAILKLAEEQRSGSSEPGRSLLRSRLDALGDDVLETVPPCWLSAPLSQESGCCDHALARGTPFKRLVHNCPWRRRMKDAHVGDRHVILAEGAMCGLLHFGVWDRSRTWDS